MNVTHAATRSKNAGTALFQIPTTLDDEADYAQQLDELRRELTVQITKEIQERPTALLIGIDGDKK